MARVVQCIKLNKEGEGMDFAPLPGDLGKKIWNQVSKESLIDAESTLRTNPVWM